MPIFRALRKQRMFISSLQLISMGIVWVGVTFHSCVFAASISEKKLHDCCEGAHEHCDTTANHEPGGACIWMSEIDGSIDSEYSVTKTASAPQPAVIYTQVHSPLCLGSTLASAPRRLASTASHPALKFRILLI